MYNIYSIKDIDKLLNDYSISPSKQRGQNFLADKNIAYNIASLLPINCNRHKYALEIGGGLGSITEVLVEYYKNKTLKVVEYDKALYNILAERYKDKISIIHKDILKTDIYEGYDNSGEFVKENEKIDIYGNIPYNIASPILEWLLEKSYNCYNYAVFMVQHDFALRLTASVGTSDYSSLTVFSKLMADIKIEFQVPKSVFKPVPKVLSSVISIVPKEVDRKILPIYKALSKTLFHNRRKTLKNNFLHSPYITITPMQIDYIFESFGIDKNIRGEDLDTDTVLKIAIYLNS